MPCRIHVERRPVVAIRVPMETRRIVQLTEERVLRDESPQLRVEVASLGEDQVRLSVVEMSCEGEAVLGEVQLGWEAEVAPNRWVRCDSVASILSSPTCCWA